MEILQGKEHVIVGSGYFSWGEKAGVAGCGVLEQRDEEETFAEPTPDTRWEAYLVTDQKVCF